MKRSLETRDDGFERSIDRTLEALGAVEPPAGLERRVLAALEASMDSAMREGELGSPQSWGRSWRQNRRQFWRWPWAAVGMMSCCAAAAVVLAGLLLHVPRAAIHSPSARRTVSSQGVSHAAAVIPEAAAQRASEPGAPLLAGSRRSTGSAAPSLREVEPVGLRPPGTPGASQADAAAVDDLHASSHPAPPMPLTAQEKLLLRMLHHGETVELAELDPAVLAAFDVEERATFHNFFEPPQDPRLQKLKETAIAIQP